MPGKLGSRPVDFRRVDTSSRSRGPAQCVLVEANTSKTRENVPPIILAVAFVDALAGLHA